MPPSSEPPSPRRRVLVVTEDPLYGELLKYGLTARGHACTVAEAGPDVRKVVARSEPDVIVLDLFMAVTEGFKLLHWLRDQSGMEIPVLVLLSSEDRTLTVEIMVAGAHDVHVKPVTFPFLLQSLEDMGGHSEASWGDMPRATGVEDG